MDLIAIPNLSERIRSVVRERIVNGDLAADSRINEVHLARDLEVSRTPLREALNALVAEGALVTKPRRGFFVRPLSAEEFQQIYPIRALLDPEALRLSGLPTAERILRLKAMNQALEDEPDAEQRILLDDAWHLEWVADCPNLILLELIRQFMLRTRRYELAYFRDPRNLATACDDHHRMLTAARDGDLERVIEALKLNLTHGIEPILEWLGEGKRPKEVHNQEE